jgi:Xaa-Pro aminopeptidase
MSVNSYESRLKKLKEKIQSIDANGVILVPGPNMQYYTGVRSMLLERPLLLFIPIEGEPHIVIPLLESGPYKRSLVKLKMHKWDDALGPFRAFERVENKLKGVWGCEGSVPFRFLNYVMRFKDMKLVNVDKILQSIRELKEPEEIQYLKRATSILCRSYLRIPEILDAEISELELARRLREEIYSNEAESCDFCLVQSGERAADPHTQPSSKRIKRGEGVVIDSGCTYAGYNADITRTIVIGKNDKLERAYTKVLAAQEEAIRVARPRLEVGHVDQAARGYLKDKNLDRYFIHRTGHGLGLEVHEAPYITPGGKELLQPSMVFTIEPGVYMPGQMGIRIEDDIVMTGQGSQVMSSDLPKEFGWWR